MARKNKILLSVLILSFIFSSPNSFAFQSACNSPVDFLKLEVKDITRLNKLKESRFKGINAALREENQANREMLANLFENDFFKIDDRNKLFGKYNCRTIKLGGLGEITAYKLFKCEIWAEEEAIVIKKTTGSQNFMGILTPSEDGYVYSGAKNYGYEKIYKLYGDDKERNQVGCLNALNKEMTSFVLELPSPKLESYHDIILLNKEN